MLIEFLRNCHCGMYFRRTKFSGDCEFLGNSFLFFRWQDLENPYDSFFSRNFEDALYTIRTNVHNLQVFFYKIIH